MSITFVGAVKAFSATFIPHAVQEANVTYVQINASAFSSALEVAVSNATRALEKPDVPPLVLSKYLQILS